jgi:hypothetical protein
VTFLIPVSAVLLGAVLLGEPLHAREAIGTALIGFGLAAIDGRLPREFARRLLHPMCPGAGARARDAPTRAPSDA